VHTFSLFILSAAASLHVLSRWTFFLSFFLSENAWADDLRWNGEMNLRKHADTHARTQFEKGVSFFSLLFFCTYSNESYVFSLGFLCLYQTFAPCVFSQIK